MGNTPFNLYTLLTGTTIQSLPPITISNRSTDRTILYNRDNNRLDRISGNVYGDETYWRVLLWANPAYYLEFDIPNNTIIRIPLPFSDVLTEITNQIIESQ